MYMSIVTLKKKTAAKYNNNSVGQSVFALNGTHRNQGFVGQTSLSRFTSRTLMRNGAVRNAGGCCGTFPIAHTVMSGIATTEDSNVVKPSALSTEGMIHTKYRWIWRPQPYAVVKGDVNQHLNTQSDYIKNVRNMEMAAADAAYKVPECKTYNSDNVLLNCDKSEQTNVAKPQSDFVSVSQGEYLFKLSDACISNDDAVIVKNTRIGQPFAGMV
jgi:hypothetical protein